MALQGPIPIESSPAFPRGAYAAGGFEPVRDFEASKGGRFVQSKDKTTGLRWHLNCFALDGDEGLVFTSPRGLPLRHSQFRQRVWVPALTAAGLTGVHFHDLRHTGNTLAANAGASLRELMDRMGHDNERAALIYQFSRQRRPPASHRRQPQQARSRRTQANKRARSDQGIGHATGTEAPEGILIMIQNPTYNPLTCTEAKRPDRDSNAGPTA
jgi:hypothetical protein